METIASCTYEYSGSERIEVALGLRQLAYTLVATAFEECMGRLCGVSGDRARVRRKHCADALRWFRHAGKLDPVLRKRPIPDELRQSFVGSIDWCGAILGIEPVRLAREGVHRIPNSGLRNWRRWRAERGRSRIRRLPVLSKWCECCGSPFNTKNPKQRHCGNQCATVGRQHLGAGKDYLRFCLFAQPLGVRLTESQWRVLTS